MYSQEAINGETLEFTTEVKNTFRHSIASQSSATTTTTTSSASQRLSSGSLDAVVDEHLERLQLRSSEADLTANTSRSTLASLPPSSRYLLSGATNSENLRNQVLRRFYPSRHQKTLSNSFFFTSPSSSSLKSDNSTNNKSNTNDSNNNSSNSSNNKNDISSTSDALISTLKFDPWCTSLKYALEHCIFSDWMYKHETPVFAFSRSWKRRLLILVDQVVLIYKTAKSTSPAQEHFILTEDTFVFVTEEFKKGYVIEIRKPFSKWHIRCDSLFQLRTWLESMKKIVACIKIGYTGDLTSELLSTVTLTDDYRILVPVDNSNHQHHHSTERRKYRQSLPVPTKPQSSEEQQQKKRSLQRQSLADIPDWESTLPPQLPPPRTKLPPVPQSPLPTVSEDI